MKEEMKEEEKVEMDEYEEQFSSNEEMIRENSKLYQKIVHLSAQLGPILDRAGRLLTDFSPHLMRDVTDFNRDLTHYRVEPVMS